MMKSTKNCQINLWDKKAVWGHAVAHSCPFLAIRAGMTKDSTIGLIINKCKKTAVYVHVIGDVSSNASKAAKNHIN